MYNSITEAVIRQIPKIGEIDVERLPQELTRVYSKIIGIRRNFFAEKISLPDEQTKKDLHWLQSLAGNLEVLLLSSKEFENKESIAFVAATAHALIQRIFDSYSQESNDFLNIDTISSRVSSSLLFLIANSPADAIEISSKIKFDLNGLSIQNQLLRAIKLFCQGKLIQINDLEKFENDKISKDYTKIAEEGLWNQLFLGIKSMAAKLAGSDNREEIDFFNNVIATLSDQDPHLSFNVFTGPYHLAKLLNYLREDLLKKGVVNVPSPSGIDEVDWKEFLIKLAKERPYLWVNHSEAIDSGYLDPGKSAILTLPTGAGKSTLAELKIASTLLSGKKVIFLVPTHALESQVNSNLSKLFESVNSQVFEVDEEFTELVNFSNSSIKVMTPEKCLTTLNIFPALVADIGLVVFDEFHLIHGNNIKKDRRAIDSMYCLLNLLSTKPEADYLLISALVENDKEISEWISSITGRDCLNFNSSWKPTRQLHGALVFEQQEVNELQNQINFARGRKKTKNPSSKLKKSALINPLCLFSLKNIWETKDSADYFKVKPIEQQILLGISNSWALTANRNEIAASIAAYFGNLGIKVMVFVENPKITVSTAKKINEIFEKENIKYENFKRKHSRQIESLTHELGDLKYSYLEVGKNVGIHHGLLLNTERSLIEEYFRLKDGSSIMVATATLAQGINLPAEIVIIAGDDRYNQISKERERIPPHELLNAAGRAGRAGLSAQGAVILIPGDIITIDNNTLSNRWWDLKNQVFSKSDQCLNIKDPFEGLLDSMTLDYENLNNEELNTLYKFRPDKSSKNGSFNILDKSFYAYQAKKNGLEDTFKFQLGELIKKRQLLEEKSSNDDWLLDISHMTGLNPELIKGLSNELDLIDIKSIVQYSVIEYITFLFKWLKTNPDRISQLFTKSSSLYNMAQVIGIKSENIEVNEIASGLDKISNLLIQYVQGSSLAEIEALISGKSSLYLEKARRFVLKLIPDLSFAFGLLSITVIEKSKLAGIPKADLPQTLRLLASCIREGFDNPEKLLFVLSGDFMSRVEVHKFFNDIPQIT